MKKFTIIICLVLISKLNFSQSFVLLDSAGIVDVTGTIVTVPITANTSYSTYFKIKNNTANNINYKVDRVYLTPPVCSGNDIFFCAAAQCYPPDSATITYSSSADIILANQTLPSDPTNFGILADYNVGANCCSEDVMYKVYNLNNSSDFSIVTIRYSCISGINDIETKGTMSSAYPNPSNSFVSIKYNVIADSKNDKIIFYDISGKAVKEVSLQNKEGVSKIDISDISAGTYFYSLIVNDKAVQTKKLIVSSK